MALTWCYKQEMVEIPTELARELAPEERILWAGRPRQGIVFHALDLVFLPFFLAWSGGVGAAIVSMLRSPKGDIIGVFVLLAVFAPIALYLIVGRFLVDARQRSKTFYAVSNERVVIVWGLFSRTVKSIDLKFFGEMTLTERRNGRGSIVFGPLSPFDWMHWSGAAGFPGMGSRLAGRFDGIPDVRSVYNTIKTAQRALPR
jgi:hypothetical protein